MSTQDQKSAVETTPKKAMGRARVKPRHLSPLICQLIVDQFKARRSSEDVAEELRLPIRTVTDVLLLHSMRPAASAGLSLLRSKAA